MAQQTYYQGRNLVIYYDGVPVGCSKTATFELTTAISNSTTKCDVGADGVLWTRNSPQENSWKLTDNGVVPMQTSAGLATEHSILFFAKAQALQQYGYAVFQNGEGILVGGNVWITSTKITGATTEDVTYDVTLDGDGPLQFIPVS